VRTSLLSTDLGLALTRNKGGRARLPVVMTYRYVGVVSGCQRWAYKSPYVDSSADAAGATEYYIDVLLPDTYSAAKKYHVVYIGEVEPTPSAYADGIQTMRSLGYHNTYDLIFVRSLTKDDNWFGQKNDGTKKYDLHYLDLANLIDNNYSTDRTQEGRSLLGFSKTGWGVVSMILRNPSVYGYCMAWDSPIGIAWNSPEYGQSLRFGSSAQFALYDPAQILAANKAALTDKPRLYWAGYDNFGTYATSFKATLDANSVPYVYHSADAGSHDWLKAWLDPAMDNLQVMRTGVPPSWVPTWAANECFFDFTINKVWYAPWKCVLPVSAFLNNSMRALQLSSSGLFLDNSDFVTITGNALAMLGGSSWSAWAETDQMQSGSVFASILTTNSDATIFKLSNGKARSYRNSGGKELDTSNAADWTGINKVVVSGTASGRSICLNGGDVASDAYALSTITSAKVGAFETYYLNGYLRRLSLSATALSNAEAQARTA